MRRQLALRTKILQRFDNSTTECEFPQAIDKNAGCKRIFRAHEPGPDRGGSTAHRIFVKREMQETPAARLHHYHPANCRGAESASFGAEPRWIPASRAWPRRGSPALFPAE